MVAKCPHECVCVCVCVCVTNTDEDPLELGDEDAEFVSALATLISKAVSAEQQTLTNLYDQV